MLQRLRPALALAACLLPFSQQASALNLPNQLEFDGGYFSEVEVTGEECAQVFEPDTYKVQHFRMGPTRRTSVMHFVSSSDVPDQAFFHRTSFYGNLGGSNDLYYKKDFVRGGVTYRVLAEGIIDVAGVVLEFGVVGRDADGNRICDATATFAAFN